MSVTHLRDIIYNDILGRGKTDAAAKEWGSVAAEFELVNGLKEKYTRAHVTAFLVHLRKRGLLQSTINKYLKAIRLLAEIQHWGEGPQGTDFPKLSLKRISDDEIRRTILSKESIGSVITLGKKLLNANELCLLALATTYGLRRVEMARLTTDSFVDGKVTIDTAKGGAKTTHLIPAETAEYLTDFRPYKPNTLTEIFQRIARKTGLKTGAGYGWHSIRRSLITELILADASSLNVMRFMRWNEASIKEAHGMLVIYAKRDQDRIDKAIFKMHPFLPYWGK